MHSDVYRVFVVTVKEEIDKAIDIIHEPHILHKRIELHKQLG